MLENVKVILHAINLTREITKSLINLLAFEITDLHHNQWMELYGEIGPLAYNPFIKWK